MSRSSSSRNRFNSGLWIPSINEETMPDNFPTYNIIVPGRLYSIASLICSSRFILIDSTYLGLLQTDTICQSFQSRNGVGRELWFRWFPQFVYWISNKPLWDLMQLKPMLSTATCGIILLLLSLLYSCYSNKYRRKLSLDYDLQFSSLVSKFNSSLYWRTSSRSQDWRIRRSCI